MPLLLTLVFVLSGAAGLIYESIWSRYLGLFVGHSAYAQVIVLVIFLGGMSAGAALIGRRSSRIRDPLLWYAVIEVLVGMAGIAFHDVFGAVSAFAYARLFPALAGGVLLTVVKWSLAAALILPQSVLLGATFPLMTAGFLRRTTSDGVADSGRVLGLLYFANSIGAAAGVLVAGFYLLGAYGLPGTLLTAAFLNVICGGTVYAIVRLQREAEAPLVGEPLPPPPPPIDAPVMPALPTLRRLLLGVALGTALASFVYEIVWIRMLALVLGSATHAFELMLSAFILGLALGAWWIRARADTLRDPIRTLGVIQWLMGAAAVATLGFYLSTFDWTAYLLSALQKTDEGYRIFNLSRYAICLIVMLPATFCAGMTLPLITRLLIGAGAGERAIGQVYSVNTLGSIVGAALASLVLLPLLGFKTLLLIGGGIDMALGVLLLWWAGRTNAETARFAAMSAAGAFGILITTAIGARIDPGITTAGVFRYGSVPKAGEREIAFYADGRTSTVSVRRADVGNGPGAEYSLATNGKPDASLSPVWFRPPAPFEKRKRVDGDESTQILLPLITLAHAPFAKEGAVIGQGSGMSSHFLLGSSTLERLTT
ncbi:MAG: fused MFS/spermidine synthase, partial [Gemmatimonadaceae bacterium]|nr:fused MFS/spermidine synthase [Gemmatimonadaceae bacterium]